MKFFSPGASQAASLFAQDMASAVQAKDKKELRQQTEKAAMEMMQYLSKLSDNEKMDRNVIGQLMQKFRGKYSDEVIRAGIKANMAYAKQLLKTKQAEKQKRLKDATALALMGTNATGGEAALRSRALTDPLRGEPQALLNYQNLLQQKIDNDLARKQAKEDRAYTINQRKLTDQQNLNIQKQASQQEKAQNIIMRINRASTKAEKQNLLDNIEDSAVYAMVKKVVGSVGGRKLSLKERREIIKSVDKRLKDDIDYQGLEGDEKKAYRRNAIAEEIAFLTGQTSAGGKKIEFPKVETPEELKNEIKKAEKNGNDREAVNFYRENYPDLFNQAIKQDKDKARDNTKKPSLRPPGTAVVEKPMPPAPKTIPPTQGAYRSGSTDPRIIADVGKRSIIQTKSPAPTLSGYTVNKSALEAKKEEISRKLPQDRKQEERNLNEKIATIQKKMGISLEKALQQLSEEEQLTYKAYQSIKAGSQSLQ